MKTKTLSVFALIVLSAFVLAASASATQSVRSSGLPAVGNYQIYLPLVARMPPTTLDWNTFMGSAATDYAHGIAVDRSGSIYVTGDSNASWGTPAQPWTGGYDAFVARLNDSGALQWNTFMGAASDDIAYGIVEDGSGDFYVTGYSFASWGMPVRPYAGGFDGFVARLNDSGALQWNAFLGSASYDIAYGIALDTSGNLYVAGWSGATWGTPVNPWTGGYDAFVAKFH